MLKKLFILFVLLNLFDTATAQQNLNFTQLARWDDNTLPIRDSLQYNDCWGFERNGREYAVIGSLTKTHFIEVTNTSSPLTQVTNFTFGANSIWRDYKYYRGYVYGVADEGSEGLRVYNVNNINATTNRVTHVFTNTTNFVRCHNIWIDSIAGRLYCAGTNSRFDGIIVFDIKTNPASPVICGSMSLRSVSTSSSSGYVHDVHVYNGKMYCSHIYTGRMDVYDVTNINNWVPGNATITTVPRLGFIKVPGSGYNHSSYLSEDKTKLIMAEETHGRPLTIVDVSNPAAITALSTMYSCSECSAGQNTAPNGSGSIVHNPFVKDNLVYLAYYHEGLVVYDIANPCGPVKVAQFDTDFPNRPAYYSSYYGAWGAYPYLSSGKILISDVLNGLYVVSLNTAQVGRKVAMKVNLAGMDDVLRTDASFPTSDPYRTSTYSNKYSHVNNCNISKTTSTIINGNNIVDWVFVELRTGTLTSTTVVQTKAALVQNDGDVVDMDGVSPLNFSGNAGNFYIAIRHRNHLGFRTMNPVALSGNVTNLDFTNNSVAVYGTTSLVLVNNVTRMVGGDANLDGSIDGTDSSIWEVQNGSFANPYQNMADFNLDGSVDGSDAAFWELVNGSFQEIY
jgi:choice-of-anchor B domain-containing protein